MMRLAPLAILPVFAAVLSADTPRRAGNVFQLAFAEGGGRIEWVSPSTFRFTRYWSGEVKQSEQITGEAVQVKAYGSESGYKFETKYLTVEVDTAGRRLTVNGPEGVLLASVLGKGSIESAIASRERLYGLGPRRSAKLDLRGSAIDTTRPFLLSSAGYGEYFPAPGRYRYDLGTSQAGRRRTRLPDSTLDFYFYYGPGPKEILEEHLAVTGEDSSTDQFAVRDRGGDAAVPATWQTLREAVLEMQHAGFSAIMAAQFDLGPFQAAGGRLYRSAARLASLLPRVVVGRGDRAGLTEERQRWIPYLASYGYEARVRGIPFLRAMALQFPDDERAAARTGQFMIGDELLVAPALSDETKIGVYLPQGIWTDLRTNTTYDGRQDIVVDVTDSPAVFARNGQIVPIMADGIMELHYLPKLGGEFFIYEEGRFDVTQVHAAPALDVFRVEIESQVTRDYEWVIRHVAKCTKVIGDGAEFAEVRDAKALADRTWYYDAALEAIRIRIRARAGADHIVNISF